MNMAYMVFVAILMAVPLRADMKIVSVRGDVTVRHGAAEEWVAVAGGDVLKPEDSIRMGEKSGATVKLDDGKEIALPAMTIVDMSDLRNITQQDLLLKLAMEDVRSAPGSLPGKGEYDVPRTTTTRAGDKDGSAMGVRDNGAGNLLRLNGTAVLYDHGFYGSCVLTSREIFRAEPTLLTHTDARLRVADALVRMKLNEEALNYYRAIAAEENLPEKERKSVGEKIEMLKKIITSR